MIRYCKQCQEGECVYSLHGGNLLLAMRNFNSAEREHASMAGDSVHVACEGRRRGRSDGGVSQTTRAAHDER